MLLAVGRLSALTLAGCHEHLHNHQSFIYKEVKDDNKTLFTDAKQRVVLNQARQGPDNRSGARIICAEPRPDVAQAFTQIKSITDGGLGEKLASVAGKLFASDDKTDSGAAVQAVSAISTSLTKLGERLAVIQLFRDRMYRACEAYNNGALDEASNTLLMARYDKTMATLLTTEMTSEGFDRSVPRTGQTSSVDEIKKLIQDTGTVIKSLQDLQNKISAPDDNGSEVSADQQKKITELTGELKSVQKALEELQNQSPTRQVNEYSVGLAGEIGGIHRNFLDDSGIEPIIDACLVSFSRTKIDSTMPEWNNLLMSENRRDVTKPC